MSNFSIIPPLPIADLSPPRTTESKNVFWLFPYEALFSFWEIKEFNLNIYARKVYGAEDISRTFTCSTFDKNCVCAMPQHERLLRTLNQPFFKIDCDFACLEIDGIFFKENPQTVPLHKNKLGFSVNFEFTWDDFYLSTANDIAEEDIAQTFSIGLGISGVDAHLKRPICDWYDFDIGLSFEYY